MTDRATEVSVSPLEGLVCPLCRVALRDDGSRGECPRCRRSVVVQGGRIPDFLEASSKAAVEPALWPKESAESIADAVLRLREGDSLAPGTCEELRSLGLCDPGQQLTERGQSLAYHLAEYRRQSGEALLGGWEAEIGLDAHSRILDLGCGAGQTLRLLGSIHPERRVGVDISLEALAFGCWLEDGEGGPIEFVRASAHALPFANGEFTHVLCRVGLNYMNQRRALREMVRVLQPAGVLWCRVEGAGFDAHLIRQSGSLRERASRLLDFGLGIAHAATGFQLTPGRRLSGGRAFASFRRLARILTQAGCSVNRHKTLQLGAWGLPTGFELLARREPQGTAAHASGVGNKDENDHV